MLQISRKSLFLGLFVSFFGTATIAAEVPVTIYLTDWCPYCQKAEKYFSGKKIEYRRCNIEKDKQCGTEHEKLGGGGIPVTKIGSTVVRGFNPPAFEEALGNTGNKTEKNSQKNPSEKI